MNDWKTKFRSASEDIRLSLCDIRNGPVTNDVARVVIETTRNLFLLAIDTTTQHRYVLKPIEVLDLCPLSPFTTQLLDELLVSLRKEGFQTGINRRDIICEFKPDPVDTPAVRKTANYELRTESFTEETETLNSQGSPVILNSQVSPVILNSQVSPVIWNSQVSPETLNNQASPEILDKSVEQETVKIELVESDDECAAASEVYQIISEVESISEDNELDILQSKLTLDKCLDVSTGSKCVVPTDDLQMSNDDLDVSEDDLAESLDDCPVPTKRNCFDFINKSTDGGQKCMKEILLAQSSTEGDNVKSGATHKPVTRQRLSLSSLNERGSVGLDVSSSTTKEHVDLPAWVEVILSRLAAMESQQPQIQLQLSTILQKIGDGAGLVVDKMPDGIMLPLETFDDVDNFEIQVASEDTFKQLTNYLGLIGGKDVVDTTKRIASTLLTNHLATQLNYVGRGSQSKRGVKGLRLTLIVIGAVRQNMILHKPSDSEIENAFKNWLRFSKDRDGRRSARKREYVSRRQWAEAHVSCTESNIDRRDDQDNQDRQSHSIHRNLRRTPSPTHSSMKIAQGQTVESPSPCNGAPQSRSSSVSSSVSRSMSQSLDCTALTTFDL